MFEQLKQDLFSQWADGSINGKRFALASIVLILAWLGFLVLLVGGIVGAEYSFGWLGGYTLSETQDLMYKTLGLPVIIVFAFFCAALILLMLNITAKRLRNIGVPGWPATFAIAVILALLSGPQFGVQEAILWLALVFIPEGIVKKAQGTE